MFIEISGFKSIYKILEYSTEFTLIKVILLFPCSKYEKILWIRNKNLFYLSRSHHHRFNTAIFQIFLPSFAQTKLKYLVAPDLRAALPTFRVVIVCNLSVRISRFDVTWFRLRLTQDDERTCSYELLPEGILRYPGTR